MKRDRPSIHIDYETFSDVNLLTCGSTVYAARAVPLLLAVKYEDQKTEVFDYSDNFNQGIDDWGDFDPDYAPACPDIIKKAVKDNWYFCKHNWMFEFDIFGRSPALKHWPKYSIENMVCTQAKARYWGIPDSLEKAGRVLNLSTQKDKEGSRLIRKFCIPQTAGRGKKAQKYIRTIDPRDPDWIRFKSYNRDDVETEYLIDEALPDIPAKWMRFFHCDARMNVRGVPVDMESVERAVVYYDFFYKKLDKRFKELTGGLAPTQVAKIKEHLETQENLDMENLQSATIRDTLLEDISDEAKEVLEIRQIAAQASVKKLTAFRNRTLRSTMRTYHAFLWYGAHTSRWAGKGVQFQNFPRGVKKALRQVAAFFKWLERMAPMKAGLAIAELVYDNPIQVLSAALRGFVKAPKGKKFVVFDYSQIELRILAWLAGETALLDQIRQGLDPYIMFAALHMYNVPPESLTKESLERQIAKSALLGAQYQIWVDAFILYCKSTAGIKITVEQALLAITAYREANQNIVQFWKDLEKAFIFAVESRTEAHLNNLRLKFEVHNDREWLRVYLPSGHPLSYFEPQVRVRETEHPKLDFDGNPTFDAEGNQIFYTKRKKVFSYLTEFNGHTTREYSYGGKMAQNVTEGVLADIMNEGLLIAERHGYLPVMTVHDEGVTEVDEDFGSAEELERLVCEELPDCYEGLPVSAEGFECVRYRK